MKIECPRCILTSDIVTVPTNGQQCEYCDLHDRLEANANPRQLRSEIAKVRAEKGRYNCIIGISGGLDSSTLLYLAVTEWELRPLVIHFDNGWNGEAAKRNMDRLCEKLNVERIVYHPAKLEYDRLNDAFLAAGVPDADIPNDIAMTKLMYETADRYGIKWILNGHDFRQEGSTPAKWTYMDAKYIQSVYRAKWHEDLKHYPLFTFLDQVKFGLKGIKQIRPFHYITDRTVAEYHMKKHIGWCDYGAKHAENIYTEYVGVKLLPEKFGIDKRIVYLSARVRSKLMTKTEAHALMRLPAKFDMDKLGKAKAYIEDLAKSPIQPREMFDRYDFRAWHMKAIVWLLAKFKVVPETFYVKYCK